jgi:hypothetical protein
MASPKQIAANRRNAQKSTGPKTPAGKQVSRANAVKHGVLASVVTTRSEDAAAFADLVAALKEEYAPASQLETLLVERLASLFWRERRLLEAERILSEVADGDRAEYVRDNGIRKYGTRSPTIRPTELALLGRYAMMLEGQISRTLAMLASEQHKRATSKTITALALPAPAPASATGR